MWLLNASARTLEYFDDASQVPGGYAILSHTWADEEVSFNDIESANATRKKGYAKIDYSCKQALIDGLDYAWIDTCCIDKKSSAELSEAINSMFKWYKDASVCYAYLSDVNQSSNNKSARSLVLSDGTIGQISKSRWFTRGWTLQELIAPRIVHFFDYYWALLGKKSDLLGLIYEITKIDIDVLVNSESLHSMSVAKRMSWASTRSTSRVEDQAYSLLGIFDVNIPLLYGEGTKAFVRLQEEIIRTSVSVDHSILAHNMVNQTMLSTSPEGFQDSHNIISWTVPQTQTFEISQIGLRLGSFLRQIRDLSQIALNCRYADKPMTHVVLLLKRRPRVGVVGTTSSQNRDEDEISYDLYDDGIRAPPKSIDMGDLKWFTPRIVQVARKPYVWPGLSDKVHLSLDKAFLAKDSPPVVSWYLGNSSIILPLKADRNPSKPSSRAIIKIENSRASKELWRNIILAMETSPSSGALTNDKSTSINISASPQRNLKSAERAVFEPASVFYPGETEVLHVANRPTIKIAAELAMAMGELVWSLRLEPA